MSNKEIIKRLLSLMEEQESVYAEIDISEADKMLAAVDKKKSPTSQERKAVNYLIVGFLHSGDEKKAQWARDNFFERNQGFIGHMIDKYFGAYKVKYYEDLYNAGVVGLLEALNRFDPSRSPTGSSTSWATQWILHELCLQVNPNAAESSLTARIMDAINELNDIGIKEPDPVEISAHSGLPIARVIQGCDIMQRKIITFDEAVETVSETSNPQDEALHNERTDTLAAAIEMLPDIERECIVLSFGLGNVPEAMSPNKIAAELGISSGDAKLAIASGIQHLRDMKTIKALAAKKTKGGANESNADALFKKII